MKVVEIFRTDVADTCRATVLVQRLQTLFPNCKINFDLQDCDKILRIEGCRGDFELRVVIATLKSEGHICELFID